MSRKKKNGERIMAGILWIAVWQAAAVWIDNAIFLPSPVKTVQSLQKLFASAEFYQSIGVSLGNIARGFLLGVFTGSALAALAASFGFLETFFSIPIRIIKATPVASFTILALFWMDSEDLSVLISFFMVMPVIYANVFAGIRETDKELLEMAEVFEFHLWNKIRYLYLPSAIPYLFSASSVAIGLAWKSGVAAEVIGLAKNSIGNHLYQAKIYMEMPELFAWTMVTVVISILSEKLILLMIRGMEKLMLGKAEETVSYEKTVKIMEENDPDPVCGESKAPVSDEETAALQVKDISKAYGEKQVLSHVSMVLSPKTPIAVMGSSGIGKTTLLKIILGIEQPDSGKVIWENGRNRVAAVFQENRLIENVSVEKNLQMVCGQRENRKKTDDLLKALGLYECRKQKVSCLSGGMKRRTAIGRALAYDASVLLMDEPFQGLDEETKRQVMQLVKERIYEKSVLLITHDPFEGEFLHCKLVQL